MAERGVDQRYLHEFSDRALASRAAHLEYREYIQPGPAGYGHNNVTAEMHVDVWLSKQDEVAREKFREYLDPSC